MSQIALVHDNFAQMGGAEKVAEALYRLLPDAQLYSTLAVPERLSATLRQAPLRTSWMQHLPALQQYYRHYFLLYPLAVESLDLSRYELIVTSCFGYAKGARKHPDALHVCYCHTPMRWVWRYQDYAAREEFNLLKRALLPPLLAGLRHWDLKAAQRPDYYVANSRVVAQRIEDFYWREAVVIPPPIDVNRFKPSTEQEDYYLVLSRLSAYKRIDLAVEACTRLQRRLVVIGDGPDRRRLESLAGPTVTFMGRQPDEVVERYVARCQALLFPGEEDFGMVPLEVNAGGRPVIAYRGGGAVETVIEGETGLFFDSPTVSSLAAAIWEFEDCSWDQQRLRRHAEQFDEAVFARRFAEFLCQVMPQPAPELLRRVMPAMAPQPATAKAA
jgi:glycosyltransferase involved in cell wall biosynthesis